MAVRLSTGARNAGLDSGIGPLFDSGPGRINVYTGAQPASANDAATGTLLATLTLSSDAFAAASGGSIAANSITSDTSADASGVPGYIRIYRTGDTAPGSAAGTTDRRIDMDVGDEITFSGLVGGEIVAGGTVAISSLSITLPAG